MILDLVSMLGAILVGIVVGGLIHEIAHYIVLRACGRDPVFHKPSIAERTVSAAVEFDIPRGSTPWDIRAAALAPMVAGVIICIPLLLVGVVFGRAGLAGAVAAIIWTAKPSRRDIQIARGIQSS